MSLGGAWSAQHMPLAELGVPLGWGRAPTLHARVHELPWAPALRVRLRPGGGSDGHLDAERTLGPRRVFPLPIEGPGLWGARQTLSPGVCSAPCAFVKIRAAVEFKHVFHLIYMPWGTRDLSCLTGDRALSPAVEWKAGVLTTGRGAPCVLRAAGLVCPDSFVPRQTAGAAPRRCWGWEGIRGSCRAPLPVHWRLSRADRHPVCGLAGWPRPHTEARWDSLSRTGLGEPRLFLHS